MTGQAFRNPKGGLIDRERPLSFRFDGRTYQGYAGDTLASALLANGVRLVGRSFKYHRPRGIFSHGVEEPSGIVQLFPGTALTEANMRVTEVGLRDGLVAASQNRWPSLDRDIGALNSKVAGLFPAGFYYKTFMWPRQLWLTYEGVIRRIAGMGVSPTAPDPDRYAHRYQHADVLIAGGGPAGLMAAMAAATSGARVLLAEQGPAFGGELLNRHGDVIDGKPALEWLTATVAALEAMPNVTLLPSTTVAAYYDHNQLVLVEHRDGGASAPEAPRQRLWQVRAGEVVLATGAIERPLVFAGNDRPGVMLASAAAAYANRYAVRAGERAVVFTNNCSAYAAARDLQAAGIEVQAIVDARDDVPETSRQIAADADIGVLAGHVVCHAEGGRDGLRTVSVMPTKGGETGGGEEREIQCDLLAVSGGWTPTVHLFSQSRGKLKWDEAKSCFVPGESFQRERSAGAANGTFDLAGCLRAGAEAGWAAAHALALEPEAVDVPNTSADLPVEPLALWAVPFGHAHDKRFVDLQNDVTAEDVGLAWREGYRSVEHLKRYTTLGMGTDQGRTSNVNGLAIMAGLRDEAIPAVGTTTFRPPFTPITFGAIVGAATGSHVVPTRRTAMHDWHAEQDAPFVPAGQWLRPQAYLKDGEGLMDAAWREAKHVREKVGICDVSTLGKIDVQGKDALTFLERVYVNKLSSLSVGRCRYGLMLREDGIVFDDGTVTRLAEQRYMVTTTTGNAGAVMQHLEYLAQVEWPELDVHLISVTEEWAAIAVAGPESRTLLSRLTNDIDVSGEALPFMHIREGHFADVPARLFRISFSGELAYEVAVPADYGRDVWQALLDAGRDLDVVPYGLEALNILRIEKGHVTAGELNGRTTAADLGLGRMAKGQGDFVGRHLMNREALAAADRKRVVGLIPVDRKTPVPRGAQIIAEGAGPAPTPMLGEVTSVCWSPNLGHPIALALLAGGAERHGERLIASSPLHDLNVPVEVTASVFIDPKGEKLRG